MSGRSIRIFLVDGTTSGVRTAELGLSTIKALAIPRASLSAASKRPELEKTGVYVLLGDDPDFPGAKKIYIGEGDTILTRLTSHDRAEEKDFWDECVLFVSKDQNLTKAHVRYLEARLIQLATEAKRAKITNGTTPSASGRLPESDEVEMEEFISQARLLLGSLGYNIFETQAAPKLGNEPTSQKQLLVAPDFYYAGDRFSATCVVDTDAGHFLVKAGSTARKEEAGSLPPTYRSLRKQLIESGVLAERTPGVYTFSQDYPFSAPTAAAQVVSGTTVNGRSAWKTSDNLTLSEWQEAQLASQPIVE